MCFKFADFFLFGFCLVSENQASVWFSSDCLGSIWLTSEHIFLFLLVFVHRGLLGRHSGTDTSRLAATPRGIKCQGENIVATQMLVQSIFVRS
jgi:hypothetical protein